MKRRRKKTRVPWYAIQGPDVPPIEPDALVVRSVIFSAVVMTPDGDALLTPSPLEET